MTRLEEYTEQLVKEINEYGNLTEDEIIRYVYLKLGEKIVFDLNWIYGDNYTREKIYESSGTIEKINERMSKEPWEMTCKDIASMLSYIGKKLGVNIEIVREPANRFNRLPHVYNRVIKNNGESYCVDLYSDLYRIQMKMRTEYFGYNDRTYKKTISRDYLESIDYKLGYIDSNRYYTDEYIILLKQYVSLMESIQEQTRFILENPHPYLSLNKGYYEREIYISNLLYEVIGSKTCSVNDWLDCYYIEDNKMIPKEIICSGNKENMAFYEYNHENGSYHPISKNELIELIAKGLKLHERYKYQPNYAWLYELGQKKNLKN